MDISKSQGGCLCTSYTHTHRTQTHTQMEQTQIPCFKQKHINTDTEILCTTDKLDRACVVRWCQMLSHLFNSYFLQGYACTSHEE